MLYNIETGFQKARSGKGTSLKCILISESRTIPKHAEMLSQFTGKHNDNKAV